MVFMVADSEESPLSTPPGVRANVLLHSPHSGSLQETQASCPRKLFMPLRGACTLCSQVLPQVEQPQTGMREGVRVGLIGIGALVALGRSLLT